MGAFELPLVGLSSALLTVLALAGRRRSTPSWVGLLGPGVVAWVAGVQGVLFRRQPDYMVGYLFEVRGAAWPAYLVWAALAVGLAFGFAVATRRAMASLAMAAAVLVGAICLGALAIPLFDRLALIGSTIEFRAGIARPLDYQPAVRTLVSLTLIGSFVPVAGTILLVAADGIRSALRRPA